MNRRHNFAFWTLNIAATLCGGWLLTTLIVRLNFNMPYLVDAGIRWVLSLASHNELANTDDMRVLALAFYLVSSIIFVGVLVWIINRVVLAKYGK